MLKCKRLSRTEVILIMLLSNFKLSVPDDLGAPIQWNFAGVQWPSVGPTSPTAELPLKLELLEKRP